MTHIKSKHKGVKFPCDKCDYRAPHKGNLMRHIKSVHKGIQVIIDRALPFMFTQIGNKGKDKGFCRLYSCQIFFDHPFLDAIASIYTGDIDGSYMK